jgi:hypothetical protein
MGVPPRIPEKKKAEFELGLRLGMTIKESALRAGVSERWAKGYAKGLRDSSGKSYKEEREERKLPGPLAYEDLSDEARRAYDDFGYFRLRYFGRIASPWQEEAAEKARQLLETPHKEYVVVNCPPGSGKSTLFTHDIPVWLACRNRSIRCLIGSRTEKQARMYTARIRRSFDRLIPLKADSDEVAKGRARDAEAALVHDFGRFKPYNQDLWRLEEFVIAQPGDVAVEDKEPSFSAYGMDSGFLGGRFDLVIWDDLVDSRTLKTAESREAQRAWWETEAETRLEPGGLLILQGQRMAAEDLYRYALNMEGEGGPKYQHIIYRAHYEDRCDEDHGLGSRPYPDGCLLDPVRLPWRELRAYQANRLDKFRVLYQQEDVDPSSVLVPKVYIDGGRDEAGFDAPGCWDADRDLASIPRGLSGELYSIATCDPSPTKFWSIQWWIYNRDSEFRFLMDLIRQAMDAPDFLDWDYRNNVFTGVMEEWWQRSNDLGKPITHFIVEANAAQRFMLQYDHVKRWMALRKVQIIPHQTHRNKSDPDFGVQSIAPHYKFGRIRLPGKGQGRIASLKLVDEVTRWPEGSTDDCVMAHWFLEWSIPNIVRRPGKAPRQKRPRFIRAA